ncbi:MAG TPA: hypothetical protein VNF49_10140 [Candidatus Binataceae bacterium]|nr:hypothetical protein [Candidatus Binataceae bacterium]
MTAQDLDQAAEIAGVAKELFAAFEARLGEVMAQQRLAGQEANHALAETRRVLAELLRHAQQSSEALRAAQEELRGTWQLHVAENAKAAGAEMARTFGHEIAAGLRQRLEKLGDAVDRVTRRFEWVSALKWGLGGVFVAILALSLAAGVLIRTVAPSVDGLSDQQVRLAITRLASCRVGEERHVCAAIDDKLHAGKGPSGNALVVLSGM